MFQSRVHHDLAAIFALLLTLHLYRTEVVPFVLFAHRLLMLNLALVHSRHFRLVADSLVQAPLLLAHLGHHALVGFGWIDHIFLGIRKLSHLFVLLLTFALLEDVVGNRVQICHQG